MKERMRNQMDGGTPQSVGKARGSVEIDAVVFPPCSVCGAAYKPSRPIEDHGTIFFHSKDRVANLLYKLERVVHNLRKARMRKI